MVGTADSVLIREVSFIQSVLYREVPMYCSVVLGQDSHVVSTLLWNRGRGILSINYMAD